MTVIEQVIEQLSTMPQPLQRRVLQFARTLAQIKIQGTSGRELLKFAGTIPQDDTALMQTAIQQDCERVDIDEW